MLFITYWELNEEMSVQERLQVAQMLTSSGAFPPDGVEILRWDTTPDSWGILLTEADSAEAVHTAIAQWRAAGAGFFESTKTAPVMPVEEAIPLFGEVLESLATDE